MARKLAIQAIREEIDKRQPRTLQKGVIKGRNEVLNTLDISLGGSRSYLQEVLVASNIDVRALNVGDDAIVGWTEGTPVVLGTIARSTSVITFPTEIRSYNYQSDVTGWKIDTDGTAEFGDVKVRGEIKGTVLVRDQVSATGGKLLVAPATVLIENMHPTSTILVVRENVFQVNDIVWLKPDVDRQEYMLITDAGAKYAGGWAYLVTRNLEGDKNEQFWSGEAVVSVGDTSGSGYLMMVADGDNSPYYDVVARNSATYNDLTSRVRMGNLGGITDAYFGALSGYGLYANGNVYVTGAINSTSGTIGGWTIEATRLYATNISLYSGAANTARIQVGTGTDANTAGINSANAAGDITFWSGSTHANRATAPFRVTAAGALTATNATITGSITATSGAIGGWNIDTTSRLYATNISLYSGAANTARIEVGTGANTGGINSANGANEIIFWGGATHANRATAPFRVEADGDVIASSGIATLSSTGIMLDCAVGSDDSDALRLKYTDLSQTVLYEVGALGVPSWEFRLWNFGTPGTKRHENELILYTNYLAGDKPAVEWKLTDSNLSKVQQFVLHDYQATFGNCHEFHLATDEAYFNLDAYSTSTSTTARVVNTHATNLAHLSVEGFLRVGKDDAAAPTNLFEIWGNSSGTKMLYMPDDLIGALWFQDDVTNIYASDGNLVTDTAFMCTYVILPEGSEPGTPDSGYGYLYASTSDSHPYWKDDGGNVYDLTTGTGGDIADCCNKVSLVVCAVQRVAIRYQIAWL